MSHSNYTSNILNIKDKNITFEENCLKTIKNNNKTTMFFHGKLTYSITEGMNNLIKQIKHTACGYKKINHLKARVMLIKGLLNPIKAN